MQRFAKKFGAAPSQACRYDSQALDGGPSLAVAGGEAVVQFVAPEFITDLEKPEKAIGFYRFLVFSHASMLLFMLFLMDICEDSSGAGGQVQHHDANGRWHLSGPGPVVLGPPAPAAPGAFTGGGRAPAPRALGVWAYHLGHGLARL